MNRRQVIGATGAAVAASVLGRNLQASGSSSAPNVPRLSRSLSGETVNLRDYCAADGRRVDTQNYQELLDLRPASIVYPPDTRLLLDRRIDLRSEQTHRFASGARIDAETNDYALSGFGETGQHLAGLAQPIRRYDRRMVLEHAIDAASGDLLLLANVVNPNDIEMDANVVDRVEGTIVYLRYAAGRPFSSGRSFRLYKIDNPLRNLRFSGPAILYNHHPGGGGLRLTNSVDLVVDGLTVGDAGYVGIAIGGSLRAQLKHIAVQGAGASGLGIRASKDILIDGFTARGIRADESLTFYDNVSQVTARNIDIQQYLFQERPRGSTAGNDILVDKLCSHIALSNVTCVGSATYNVMINDRSDDCSLTDFVLRRSDLGGVRISGGCERTNIDRGEISDVHGSYDAEGRKPVSAISVGSTCRETRVGSAVRYERIATERHVASFSDSALGPSS